MSVVALSDILFGDLLTETGMKPWWEKVRGFIFASSVAVALSTTYLTLHAFPVDCLPLSGANGNISFIGNFNIVQAAWTNTYCGNGIPWFIRYSGGLTLLASIVILAVSSCWLYIPNVIDSFVSFAEMAKIILDLNLAQIELRELSFRPRKKDDIDDRQLKLRGVCEEILQGEKIYFDIQYVYRIRDAILIGATLIIATFFGVIAHSMFLRGDHFLCNIITTNLYALQGERILPETFICVSSMSYHLAVLNALFVSSVLMQILPIACGEWQLTQRVHIKTDFYNLDFLSVFWNCGRPTRCSIFSRLIVYVCGIEALEDIERKLEEAILIKDDYVLRSFAVLARIHHSKTIPDHSIMDKLLQLYQAVLNDNNTEGIESTIVTTIEKHITVEMSQEKYLLILRQSVKVKSWKLTVGIINEYVGKLHKSGKSKEEVTDDGFNLLQQLAIDYDILDENGCSIMYYLLDMPKMVEICKLVSTQYRGKCSSNLYSHHGGKSVLVYWPEVIRIDIPVDLAEVNNVNSQNGIEQYCDKFCSILEHTSPVEHDHQFIHDLSRVKFETWNEKAKDFAKRAHKNQDWVTFATLLNCYIILENHGGAYFPLACGVSEDFGMAALQEALRLQTPFVSTAAKHIVACLTRNDSAEARKMINCSDLRFEDKNELLQFIIKRNSAAEQQVEETPNNQHDGSNVPPSPIESPPIVQNNIINSNIGILCTDRYATFDKQDSENDSDPLLPTQT